MHLRARADVELFGHVRRRGHNRERPLGLRDCAQEGGLRTQGEVLCHAGATFVACVRRNP